MFYYKNVNSPWVSKLSEAKAWLQTEEELRLQGEQIDRPDTKWSFVHSLFVILKVVLDRQPLHIGHVFYSTGYVTKEKLLLLTPLLTNFVSFGACLFTKALGKIGTPEKPKS